MKVLPTTLALCVVIMTACVSNTSGSKNVAMEVRTMLESQIADWNRGDINAFMRSYWADPALRFASGGNVRRGWQTVLDDYKTRYPDTSTMGELTTKGLEITNLGQDAAAVFGHWVVTAGGQDYCGLFTLIVRNINDRWVIVHDHTSSSDGLDALGRSCADIKASG